MVHYDRYWNRSARKILNLDSKRLVEGHNNYKEIQTCKQVWESDRKPNIADLLHERKIDFIVNIPSTSTLEKYVGMLYDEYQIRRKSLELGIPVLTTPELSESFIKTLEWLQNNETTKKPLQPYEH